MQGTLFSPTPMETLVGEIYANELVERKRKFEIRTAFITNPTERERWAQFYGLD